jgi:integrase
MTLLRVRGVHRVESKGRFYYYHRATRTRLRADPSNPRAFAAEVDALNAGTPAARPDPLPGSWGGLVTRYRASPEFQTSIKPATRKSYQRVFDAVRRLDTLELEQIDQPFLLGLRDTLAERSGRWLANYAMTVISVVMAWGMPRGIVSVNAAAGVPKIRRQRGAAVANKAWKPAEVEAALELARKRRLVGLRKAIALAYYGGLRKADVVALPVTARRNGQLELEGQSKTGAGLTIFEARRLKVILDEKDAEKGPTIVRRQDGSPYTADGLDTLFHRVKADLVEAGRIRSGLTFHGLRKSLGKRAADRGHSELDIAAALGHATAASSRPYTVEAARKQGAKRVFKSLERRR